MDDQTQGLVDVLGLIISDYDMETTTMEPCVWYPNCYPDMEYYLGMAVDFEPFYDIEQAVEVANLYCRQREVSWTLERITVGGKVQFHASFAYAPGGSPTHRIIGQNTDALAATALMTALVITAEQLS